MDHQPSYDMGCQPFEKGRQAGGGNELQLLTFLHCARGLHWQLALCRPHPWSGGGGQIAGERAGSGPTL
jgi:hypothetical protein